MEFLKFYVLLSTKMFLFKLTLTVCNLKNEQTAKIAYAVFGHRQILISLQILWAEIIQKWDCLIGNVLEWTREHSYENFSKTYCLFLHLSL